MSNEETNNIIAEFVTGFADYLIEQENGLPRINVTEETLEHYKSILPPHFIQPSVIMPDKAIVINHKLVMSVDPDVEGNQIVDNGNDDFWAIAIVKSQQGMPTFPLDELWDGIDDLDESEG